MDLPDLAVYLLYQGEKFHCIALYYKKSVLFHSSVTAFCECQSFSILFALVLAQAALWSELSAAVWSFLCQPKVNVKNKKEPRPFKQSGWKRLLVIGEIVNTQNPPQINPSTSYTPHFWIIQE